MLAMASCQDTEFTPAPEKQTSNETNSSFARQQMGWRYCDKETQRIIPYDILFIFVIIITI